MDRLRQFQNLLGAMRFSGAFVGLEKICPPQAMAGMMRDVSDKRPEAVAKALSPCLAALATIGRLSEGQTQALSQSGPGAGPAAGPPHVPPGAPGRPAGPPAAAAAAPAPAAEKPAARPVTVHLPVTAPEVFVTPAVPPTSLSAASGTAITDPDAAFAPTRVTASSGQALLTLTDAPVFVEAAPRTAPPTPSELAASPFGAHPATYRGESPPFALAKDLGLGWHRASVWWVEIQSDEDVAAGRFRFERMDAMLAGLAPGMQALLTIMLPARLAQDAALEAVGLGGPGPMGGGPLAVKADGKWDLKYPEAKYEAFVRELVTRYALHPPAGIRPVRYWQFENELDLSRARSDAPGYARLMERTYAVIKSVDKNAVVLMGGVSGEDFARNFEQYYLPALRLLRGRSMDAFDLHFYGRVGDYKELESYFRAVRQGLSNAGFPSVPVWMTETGTYTDSPAIPPGLPPQTEAGQAAELVRRGVFALGLGIPKVFWAMVREGFHFQNNMFDHDGLTYDPRVSPDKPDGGRKLAYFAYRLLCAKLAGCDPKPKRLDLGPGVYAYQFTGQGGRNVVVAWADPGP